MGAPDLVVERVPLPYCGAGVLSTSDAARWFPGIQQTDGAADCYRERAQRGEPAEMIAIASTTEGDPVLTIRRILVDGREETFLDATRDAFGSQVWLHWTCDRYHPAGSTDESCSPAVELLAPPAAPLSATQYEFTIDTTQGGPPYYLMVGPLVGTPDSWAQQMLTVVSEWETPVELALPELLFTVDGPRPRADEFLEPVVPTSGDQLETAITLLSRFRSGVRPGNYRISFPIWSRRDGRNAMVHEVTITYRVPDRRTAEAVATFCTRIGPAMPKLAEPDRAALSSAIDELRSVAVELPQREREGMNAALDDLESDIDIWFGGGDTHGSLSTGDVVAIINRWCGTEFPALTIQS